MRHVFSVALFLSLCACAPPKPRDPRSISGVDPVFDHYVTAYKTYKGSGFSYDIPIQFADLDGNTVGLCTRWSSGYRQIQIDRSYWDSAWTSEQEKISLLFHELGHCDLNRDHVTSLLSNGYPTSLMYPYNLGYMSSMESYYFSELFNPSVSTTEVSLASHDCVHDIVVTESETNLYHNKENP